MSADSTLKNIQAAHTQLCETLYEAAISPQVWPKFMRQFVEITDSRSARLLMLDQSAINVQQSFKVNIDDNYHQQYVDYYVNACPWRTELKEKSPGQLYSTYLDFSCSQKQFLNTEFFTDWARPQQIHHGMCGTLYEDEQHKIQFLIQRTSEPGHYQEAEKELINSLVVPHMRRVCQLNMLYARMEEKSAAIAGAAGHSPLPFALLDDCAEVVHVSPGAERIFSRSNVLSLRQNKLTASEPKTQLRLTQLIDEAHGAALGAWDTTGGLLQIKRVAGPNLSVLISPIAGNAEQMLFSPRQPYVAVFIYDPSQYTEITEHMLCTYYGLTAAEARVACSIARGESLEDIAGTQQIGRAHV